MNRKSLLIIGCSLVFAVKTSNAQQAAVAAGGNTSGSGGYVSYSVGQIDFTTNTGPNGYVNQGVQQTYEIEVILGLEDFQINLDLQVYPNPTTSNLMLNVGQHELTNLEFQVLDMLGKVIENKKITSSIETIEMDNLPDATYFLTVKYNEQSIKTFKIIKN